MTSSSGSAEIRAGVSSHLNGSYLTSGGVSQGEGDTPPDARPHGTHAAIKRHRRTGEDLCADCRAYQRDYNREYARLRLESAVFRARRNAAKRTRDRRIYTDPARVAAINAQRRQRRRQERARDAYDRKHSIDPVAVDRAIAGIPTSLNRPERLEAVRRLRDRLSYELIAELLKVTPRQIHRDLKDLGLVTTRGEVA